MNLFIYPKNFKGNMSQSSVNKKVGQSVMYFCECEIDYVRYLYHLHHVYLYMCIEKENIHTQYTHVNIEKNIREVKWQTEKSIP